MGRVVAARTLFVRTNRLHHPCHPTRWSHFNEHPCQFQFCYRRMTQGLIKIIILSATSVSARLAGRNVIEEAEPFDDPGEPDAYSIRLVLDVPTVSAFIILVSLAIFGGIYLFSIATQQKCTCPLCTKQYEVVKNLGSGGFGTVLEVRHRSASPGDTAKRRSFVRRASVRRRTRSASASSENGESGRSGERFVLKLIPCASLSSASSAQQEAKDLRFLRHPSIVTYVDDFLHAPPSSAALFWPWQQPAVVAAGAPVPTVSASGTVFVCIVMEWCQMDLHRYVLHQRRVLAGPIPEERLIRWAAHLLSALKYCHAKGVCHRDIKSGNVFVTDDDDVRLGDFGLARTFAAAHPRTVLTDAGTDCYKSPETLLGGRRDGRKADIWALGLVVLEMASLRFTWQRPGGSLGARVLAKDAGAVTAALASIPADYSAEVRSLVRRCLTADPDERPTAEELFRSRALRRAERSGAGGGGGGAATTTASAESHADAPLPSPGGTRAAAAAAAATAAAATDAALPTSPAEQDEESSPASDSWGGPRAFPAAASVAATGPRGGHVRATAATTTTAAAAAAHTRGDTRERVSTADFHAGAAAGGSAAAAASPLQDAGGRTRGVGAAATRLALLRGASSSRSSSRSRAYAPFDAPSATDDNGETSAGPPIGRGLAGRTARTCGSAAAHATATATAAGSPTGDPGPGRATFSSVPQSPRGGGQRGADEEVGGEAAGTPGLGEWVGEGADAEWVAVDAGGGRARRRHRRLQQQRDRKDAAAAVPPQPRGVGGGRRI